MRIVWYNHIKQMERKVYYEEKYTAGGIDANSLHGIMRLWKI